MTDKPVIFIDFDGVINSWAYFNASGFSHDPPFDPVAITRVNHLVAVTGADVVLSTSWRWHGVEQCQAWLNQLGATFTVVDRTPGCGSAPRSVEIQTWLDANPRSNFVIFDDADDCDVDGRHIRTDFLTGLLDEHIDRALVLLGFAEPQAA